MNDWKNVEKELPIIDDEHEIGEVGYFGAFWSEDPNDLLDGDEFTDDDLEINVVFYYGNNNWKNNRWEKVWVKYWMEIPDYPTENE